MGTVPGSVGPHEITDCRFPPGTSKWNKIEHRLFSHVAMNWRGRPLVGLAVVVNLIAAHLQRLALAPHRFHGDWNYTIRPTSRTPRKPPIA